MVTRPRIKTEFIVEEEEGRESQRGIKNMLDAQVPVKEITSYFFFYKLAENKNAVKERFPSLSEDFWENSTERNLDNNLRILLSSLQSLRKTGFMITNKNSANEIVPALENIQIMDNLQRKMTENQNDWSPGLIFYSINHLKMGDLAGTAAED